MVNRRQGDERDHSREPFFWMFVILAVVVAVIGGTNLRDKNASDASFLTSANVGAESPAPQVAVLPTPEPTPTPQETIAVVDLTYAAGTIALAGVVSAPAVADALVAAATELVGPEAVTSAVTVDGEASLSGGVIVLRGEVDDDQERSAVLSAFADLGLDLDDRLILAGSDQSIADVLATNEDLSEVSDFLAAAGLLAALGEASEDGLTLFAPTNAAVQSLDRAAFDELADADKLTGVLNYHMVVGRISTADLSAVTALTSVQGESISIVAGDNGLVIGGATVSVADIDATNGIVHIVDAVLLPGTLRTEVALNQLVTLDPVLFGSGSATIVDDSLLILDQAARVLLENPLGRVEIQGHTDTDGPAEANLDLSQQRADAVRDYLVDEGIDPARLTSVGFGETQLKVDPEDDDDDKFANRRIEFRVT